MKRSILLLLTSMLVLSSCGLSSQYVGQRYVDGIYSRPAPEPEPVKIYSLEELKARAQQNIDAKQKPKDTLVIVLDDSFLRTRPFYWDFGLYPFAVGSIWAFHHFWDPWFWDDPFFWYDSWYWHDPWYRPWHHFYNPWGPWYWDNPWGPWGPWGPGPIYVGGSGYVRHKPGFDYSGGTYRGQRASTQPYSSNRVIHPSTAGASRMNYRPGTSSYSTRGASSGSRSYSAGSSIPENRRGSGYNYVRSYERSGANTSGSTQSYSRSQSSSYSNSRSTSGSYSSGASRSSMGSGSFGGGGASRSMGGGTSGGGASRSGGGRR